MYTKKIRLWLASNRKASTFLNKIFLHLIQVLQNLSISCICYCLSSSQSTLTAHFSTQLKNDFADKSSKAALKVMMLSWDLFMILREKKGNYYEINICILNWGRVTTAETCGQMPQWNLAKYFSVAKFATVHTG